MASVILSGTPAGLSVDDPVLANPVVAQGAGGGQFSAKWDGTEFGTGRVSCDMGAGAAGGSEGLQLNGGATPQTQAIRWGLGTQIPENGDGVTGNDLQLWSYVYPGGVGSDINVLSVKRSNGAVSFNAPVQCGIATIPTGQQTIAVANAAVTAASVIVCSPTGAPDTVADYVKGVTINAGVGFTIAVNANVLGAGWNIAWFVAKF